MAIHDGEVCPQPHVYTEPTAMPSLAIYSRGTSIVWTIFKGPLDVLIGISFGSILGIFLWFVPELKSETHPEYRSILRFLLLFSGALLSMFASRALNVDGAGALGCLVAALVAGHRWNLTDEDAVNRAFSLLWLIFQPFLFGLIGAEVDLTEIDSKSAGMSVLVLVLCLIIRTVVAFLAVFGSGFDVKQKVFISLAWLPKATVQAALGPIVLDTAVDANSSPEVVQVGKQILTVAVLGILIAAPLGAVLMALTGPHLLDKVSPRESKLRQSLEDGIVHGAELEQLNKS